MEEVNNKSKVVRTVVGVVVGLIASFVIKTYVFSTDNSIDKKLKEASETVNKSCPMYLDSLTRMDNTVALPNKTFQYNYSVKLDTSQMNINVIRENLKKIILNSVKTNPSFKEFRDNDVIIAYNYNDDKGNFLFKIEFIPKDYKQ